MTIPETRVHLRLLVPEERRQAEPAPVDRPAVRARATPRSSATTLAERDPANAAYYAANYDDVRGEGRRARRGDARRRSRRSRERRKLLTYHDAYAYFARDYGWDGHRRDPGLATSRIRRPRRSPTLIDQVKDEKVPGDLRLGGVPEPGARADRQGDRRDATSTCCATTTCPASPAMPTTRGSGLMRFDYVTMTEALGGDAAALKAFEVAERRARTRAEYPQ